MTPQDRDASPADRLIAEIATYGRTMVALSGGVDSSIVLAAAVRALGSDDVAAVTGVSPSVAQSELDTAKRFCAELGVTHHLVTTRELEVAGYRENGPTRCYFCKSTLVETARQVTERLGFPVLATGANASDVAAGFRPGIRATTERGARTPLADLGIDKATVRRIAAQWGLSTAEKPATACLSSRIAYGVEISAGRLARVERAELAGRALLAGAGLRDLRVRDLGDSVRLEVDGELVERARTDEDLHRAIRDSGFGDLPVTVEPFRSGAMNELLVDAERWRWA